MTERVEATRKRVRGFGFLMGGVLFALTLYIAYRGGSAWPWTALAGALFAIAGAALYPLMKPVYTAWMLLAFALGWINTRILLGLFFYLVLTPIGLILRLTGKDLLDLKTDRDAATYWKQRARTPPDRTRLERMF